MSVFSSSKFLSAYFYSINTIRTNLGNGPFKLIDVRDPLQLYLLIYRLSECAFLILIQPQSFLLLHWAYYAESSMNVLAVIYCIHLFHSKFINALSYFEGLICIESFLQPWKPLLKFTLIETERVTNLHTSCSIFIFISEKLCLHSCRIKNHFAR